MNVIDAIKQRRSIRKFQNRPIERSIILELIRSAGLCQSAKNRQPWRFMILEGENKDHIAEIMCQNFSQTDIPLPGYMNSAKSSAAIIRNAPVVLAIFKEKDLNWQTGDCLSIGAAIEHICLHCVELGLGSLWIRDTIYTEAAICHALHQEHLDLVSVLAIGYPSETPAARSRKMLEDIIITPQ